jgi:hypothetical protein
MDGGRRLSHVEPQTLQSGLLEGYPDG